MKILLVSPHPDDEIVGAPGLVVHLIARGDEVWNLPVSLGRREQRHRRAKELLRCEDRLGLMRLPRLDLGISKHDGDDLDAAATEVAAAVFKLAPEFDAIISPGYPDGHYAHELVAQAIATALDVLDDPPIWLTWGTSLRSWPEELIADDFAPVAFFAYGPDVMDQAIYALEAHAGELERHDFREEITSRAAATARVLGIRETYADALRVGCHTRPSDKSLDLVLPDPEETTWPT